MCHKLLLLTDHSTEYTSNSFISVLSLLILKHLPCNTLQLLLTIFNYWILSRQPGTKPLLLLYQKPGKDSENPKNYCPIALTSCLSKTLEQIIKTTCCPRKIINLYLSKLQLAKVGTFFIETQCMYQSTARSTFLQLKILNN